MNLVNLNADGKVVDVNCNGASTEAPDWIECDDSFDGKEWKQDDSRRIAAIKAQAKSIIYGRFDQEKQLNMLARYSELNGRYVILPYTAEAKEKAALEDDYDWIKSVRAESNRLEADPKATPNWPK